MRNDQKDVLQHEGNKGEFIWYKCVILTRLGHHKFIAPLAHIKETVIPVVMKYDM